MGEASLRRHFDESQLIICDEFNAHAVLFRAERERAKANKVEPDLISVLHSLGGVSIVYRRTIQDSPAYISNHEELSKALEEGILYQPLLEPKAAVQDEHHHIESLVCQKRYQDEVGHWHIADETVTLPAKCILVATGARPNVAYAFEHDGELQRNGLQYQTFELQNKILTPVPTAPHCKAPNFGPFTSYEDEDFNVLLCRGFSSRFSWQCR